MDNSEKFVEKEASLIVGRYIKDCEVARKKILKKGHGIQSKETRCFYVGA